MKILIISGFLGAGKTTFIKELVKHTEKEVAVFENEFAASGLDGDILKEETSLNIWEMTEGCICCSSKGDFVASILTIANTISPEYLIIEPTGVAMLSNLITNLRQIEYERIQLMSPIAIVDALSINRRKKEFYEIYRNQIEFAGTVILSKSEQLSDSEKERLKIEISTINKNCNITLNHYSAMPESFWNELLTRYLDGSVEIAKNEEGELPDSFSISKISVKTPEFFIIFLENLVRGLYGNIVRAKGSFSIRGLNLRFDVVDTRYSIQFNPETISDKVVFIGNNIKRQEIRKVFFETSKFIKIGLKKIQ